MFVNLVVQEHILILEKHLVLIVLLGFIRQVKERVAVMLVQQGLSRLSSALQIQAFAIIALQGLFQILEKQIVLIVQRGFISQVMERVAALLAQRAHSRL